MLSRGKITDDKYFLKIHLIQTISGFWGYKYFRAI